ncbi:hypothetical protein BaRGS_00001763 [Batillaria attramentaria]|uniref:Uncharacterized protein n=1 Tax=Batillaria attramentaria TaxID=370345 RepID=A0ABD0M5I9_9CAEN
MTCTSHQYIAWAAPLLASANMTSILPLPQPYLTPHHLPLLPQIISDAMAYVWEDYLKGRFSAQAEQAWRSVFTFISGTMADGYIQETMDRETAMRSSSLELDPTAPTIRTELPPSMRARLKSTHAKTMSAP